MFAETPDALRTFFAPQMEQLRMAERPVAHGGGAALPPAAGNGYLWVAALGEDCLLSVHDFVLHDDIFLREFPTESYCLSLMSASTAHVVDPVRGRQRAGDAFAIYQDGSATAFTLPGGARCWATTLCFTPRYLERASALLGADPDDARRALLAARAGALPARVSSCLEGLRPTLGPAFEELLGTLGGREARPGGISPAAGRAAGALPMMAYASKAFEAFSLVVGSHLGKREAVSAQDAAASQLVEEALRAMEGRLAQPITLEGLACDLYVSRSALCEAFRTVKGAGAFECLSALRHERAEELLAGTDMSIAQVAQAVGYRHQSSFCAAFKRRCGMPPAAFRAAVRAAEEPAVTQSTCERRDEGAAALLGYHRALGDELRESAFHGDRADP